MIPVDSFTRYILSSVPGCAEPSIELAVVNAARAFCVRTQLWRGSVELAVSVEAPTVTVTVPAQSVLHKIESARLLSAGSELDIEPITLADLDRLMPGWRTFTQGMGRWYTQEQHGEVTVVPFCAGTLKLTTVLKPDNTAIELPDFLLDDYQEEIADGALARLLILPKQPFTDPNLAQVHMARFNSRLDELASKSVRGQQRGPLRTRARFF